MSQRLFIFYSGYSDFFTLIQLTDVFFFSYLLGLSWPALLMPCQPPFFFFTRVCLAEPPASPSSFIYEQWSKTVWLGRSVSTIEKLFPDTEKQPMWKSAGRIFPTLLVTLCFALFSSYINNHRNDTRSFSFIIHKNLFSLYDTFHSFGVCKIAICNVPARCLLERWHFSFFLQANNILCLQSLSM